MGIRVDIGKARQRLAGAVDLARSDETLPVEWLEQAVLVGEGPAKTYTTALGTALLARATDERVDALALKEASGERAYSARTLGHGVLVPAAVEYGFDLRTTGREPLNNQPFFRYDRVDAAERVMYPTFHAAFVDTLLRVNQLSSDEALEALGAFLRVAFSRAQAKGQVDLRDIAVGLRSAIDATRTLLAENIEGGKRAQAVVAAAFDTVYGPDRVRTERINSPSRHFPGDVQALDTSGQVLLSAEVRAKPMPGTEMEQFTRNLAEHGITRGMAVALSPSQARLDITALTERIARERGVLMTIVSSVEELLVMAFTWSPSHLAELLSAYPNRVLRRLDEMEVERGTVARWEELVRSANADPQEAVEPYGPAQ